MKYFIYDQNDEHIDTIHAPTSEEALALAKMANQAADHADEVDPDVAAGHHER